MDWIRWGVVWMDAISVKVKVQTQIKHKVIKFSLCIVYNVKMLEGADNFTIYKRHKRCRGKSFLKSL